MEAEKVLVREILEVLISKDKMSLNYVEIKQNLYTVKAKINALLKYMESNQSQPDKRFIDREIYSRLADLTTKILQSDARERERMQSQIEKMNR